VWILTSSNHEFRDFAAVQEKVLGIKGKFVPIPLRIVLTDGVRMA